MKIIIDTDAGQLTLAGQTGETKSIPLFSKEAFELVSREWVRVGWNQKYHYTFSWLGRPVIQLPEDLIRIQEVIFRIKPDVIIETGVAHGGSLIYYASLCKVLGHGKVIGIDLEIREHNRKAILAHELAPYITLIQGDSVAPDVISQVSGLVAKKDKVLILLDSCHTAAHVLKELEAYGLLVSEGSYIVATDGIMRELSDVPRGKKEWIWDHPVSAAEEFLKRHPEFVQEQPLWPFNESQLERNITHWPHAYLKRIARK